MRFQDGGRWCSEPSTPWVRFRRRVFAREGQSESPVCSDFSGLEYFLPVRPMSRGLASRGHLEVLGNQGDLLATCRDMTRPKAKGWMD